VKKHLEQEQLKPLYAEISMVPQSTVKLSGKEAQQMLRLMESLEDSDDVQHVYANFDISDAELEQLSA
jgi:transcriptional/translational regulatory protein YebC/TACO1